MYGRYGTEDVSLRSRLQFGHRQTSVGRCPLRFGKLVNNVLVLTTYGGVGGRMRPTEVRPKGYRPPQGPVPAVPRRRLLEQPPSVSTGRGAAGACPGCLYVPTVLRTLRYLWLYTGVASYWYLTVPYIYIIKDPSLYTLRVPYIIIYYT